MNCPAKTEPILPDGHNQSPNDLCSDLTARSDLGRLANARLLREHRLSDPGSANNVELIPLPPTNDLHEDRVSGSDGADEETEAHNEKPVPGREAAVDGAPMRKRPIFVRGPLKIVKIVKAYTKFMGPGFIIAVAYIDPGNYATDVAAGASYRFKLLFMILLSNIIAIFLQSLCINLGTVTGMNLAQMIRAHCPRWLNYLSYAFGESAIIATDMAEVIGTAIALSMLSDGKLPLVAGCALSIVDVLFILMFYRQNGASMNARRLFECFVALLVIGVVICFCIQLSYLQHTAVGDVFHGYLPSSALVQGQGLYQACGILGATVMPHSLYLGSGLVQDRLRDFDKKHDLLSPEFLEDDGGESEGRADDLLKYETYRPSLKAICSCRGYAIAECAISLFTFALFVNSAILIVAGASLYGVPGAANASLFGIYDLLSRSLAPAAGKIFAVALLLSGTSAGIVCTIAGQMVSEGQLRLKVKPWKRRLLTRGISIIPSIIVAGALGGPGVDKALVGSQVALSVILPFVSAPLVWFTMHGKYMTVTSEQVMMGWGVSLGVIGNGNENGVSGNDNGNDIGREEPQSVNMRVHPITAFLSILIWGLIVIMNVALLVLLGLGKT